IVALLIHASLQPSPRVIYGPAAVLGSTLPLYSYFWVNPDLLGARYLYFASAGWGLLVAELLGRVVNARRAWVLVIAGLSAVLVGCLEINLQPWRTVGTLVDALRAGLERGEPAKTTLASWESTTGLHPVLEDGIPHEYEGVGIFV